MFMNIVEDFRVAWMGLRTNKLRSGLTMLGIIIGVAAVIALVSVGRSASSMVTEQVESLGSNLVMVFPSHSLGVEFTMDDVEAVRERIPGVAAASPVISGNVTATWGGQTHNTSLRGVSPEYLQIQSWGVRYGQFFSQQEFDARQRFAVIGQTVADELFGMNNPLHRTIGLNGHVFRVIGVLEEKGATMGQDMDDAVLIPATTAQRLLGTNRVQQIYAQAKTGQQAALVTNHISRVMDIRFHQEDSVNVFSQEQILDVVSTMTGTLTLMLGAIAGISLLVGGIGIMNIMLVSVTERTREIGVRKALGARRRDIRNQFLVEALFLSVMGGTIGIALGGVGSTAISRLAGWNPGLSLNAILLAFGFSAAVGIIFGLWPALNAAKMDPVEALRYE